MSQVDEALPILERTPEILRVWLAGLPERWTLVNEGPETWSAYDIVGHLIHGERTDWLPRIEHILEHGAEVAFTPFDREAMFTTSKGKTLDELLTTFAELRRENLARLVALGLTESDMARRGLHPELGSVTLGELVATWVTHDLSHFAQIARVMAKQNRDAIGPWRAYLPVVD
ncbi:MAG: DinB family protein [Acidobacteriota bacterium]